MRDISEPELQQIREMDVETLAKFVFRYLKDNLNPHPENRGFYSLVQELQNTLFPNANDSQSKSDYVKLFEAITLLERRGLVVKDRPLTWINGNQKRLMVYLTSTGRESDFDNEILLLVDEAEEIVRALEQKVGNLDLVVRQYYLESLRAYQEGLYISSVICLGAASERAIHWLAESIESASEKYQEQIEKRRDGNIFGLTKYLSDNVIPIVFGTDKEFTRELKELLDLLGNLYRENRNEAGHPKAVYKSWLEEGQGTLLLYFRKYITAICEAIERLEKQSSS